jgi:hypothetical protein
MFHSRLLGLVIGLVFSRVAHADDRLPDLGLRLGFAEQTHRGGRTQFAGHGFDLGIEGGVRVVPSLSVRVGLERGPRLVHPVPWETDGDTELRDTAIVVAAELHLDPFLVGAGGGWVDESSTEVIWAHDGLGPTDPSYITQTRSGQLVLARAGVRLASTARVTANLVVQLTAQRVTGPESRDGPVVTEHAYGASIGMEIRGPAAAASSIVADDRSGSLFIGPDIGLTDTINDGWDNAAPRAGLELGGYVTPSIAIDLGAAGATYMSSEPDRHDYFLRFTVGAEGHHGRLFASGGGGFSRYKSRWFTPSYYVGHAQDSPLFYIGGGVELPGCHVRYRFGGEVSTFSGAFAFTLTFGTRFSSER